MATEKRQFKKFSSLKIMAKYVFDQSLREHKRNNAE